jgi:Alcohol dehydrogenase transcription factor Myb/SANT-like
MPRLKGPPKFPVWKQAQNELLIDAYQQEEDLYAIDSRLYYNRDARVAAWRRMGQELGISGQFRTHSFVGLIIIRPITRIATSHNNYYRLIYAPIFMLSLVAITLYIIMRRCIYALGSHVIWPIFYSSLQLVYSCL